MMLSEGRASSLADGCSWLMRTPTEQTTHCAGLRLCIHRCIGQP